MGNADTLDQAWKDILAGLFPSALAFFLPELAHDADKERPFEFLEQEMRMASRGSRGKGFVDALIKVPLKGGGDEWVLLHVEVQGRVEGGIQTFPERMFSYFTRIWDKYRRRVTALAILTEPEGLRVEDHLEMACYGTCLRYRYNVYRVMAAEDAVLLASDNPFALVIYAMKKRHTLRNDRARSSFNLELLREMRKKGRPAREREAMFYFLDGILPVENDDVQDEYVDAVKRIEEDEPMPIMTVYEKVVRRRAINEGRDEGIKIGLDEGIKIGLDKGVQKGRVEERAKNLRQMLDSGASIEMAMALMGLTREEILSLIK